MNAMLLLELYETLMAITGECDGFTMFLPQLCCASDVGEGGHVCPPPCVYLPQSPDVSIEGIPGPGPGRRHH